MITRRFMVSAVALVGAAAFTRALQAVAGADDGTFSLHRGEAEWRRVLAPERFAVLRRGEPEPAFSSPLRAERRSGTYACAGCDQDAFSSAAKLDDGSGWPGFWAPFYGAAVETEEGTASAFHVAVRCSRCGGHFDSLSRDAPTPTGLHYRINGLAILFTPAAA